MASASRPLEKGTLRFSVEGRILRELGERLVKQPEVALVELIKNSYDADATTCEVLYNYPKAIAVQDNGHGMTLKEFREGWMRIATGQKGAHPLSRKFRRIITGEKGIGRFAVRFLGKVLRLRSVAHDPQKGFRTLLIAEFNWREFDRSNDLDDVKVPFTLHRADADEPLGTTLTITSLRPSAADIDLNDVRTASISVVTPFHVLLKKGRSTHQAKTGKKIDPGFSLRIEPAPLDADDGDVARIVLNNAVIRADLDVHDERMALRVFKRGSAKPKLTIVDRIENFVGPLHADIRFFPYRKGTFADLPVDGRIAKSWVRDHSGVAVFDRRFRVLPYGTESDDWLSLAADTARRARTPRSSIAKKHFPMDEPTRKSTQLNYMLRLPYPNQLVGIVEVQNRRSSDEDDGDRGLIPAADREGFVDNAAFRQLEDLVRGAVEAIAAVDRELQQEQEQKARNASLRLLRSETRQAVKEIQANRNIRPADKSRLIRQFVSAQAIAEEYAERTRERENALETMSLLGVVAGFMTHEFGGALDELQKTRTELISLSKRDTAFASAAEAIDGHLTTLRELVTYSEGYIRGASARPEQGYPVKPRIKQVIRVFGKYASDRAIRVEVNVDPDLPAPPVPVSLYNGLALNLFTNALKAVVAKAGVQNRVIEFRARNDDKWHYLEVADTGIGIPSALRQRVFDPLFTTTASADDPLGSGMGLGLALVKRAAESFGGRAAVIDPPENFSTCVEVRLPLEKE